MSCHIRAVKKFLLCAKTADSEVPDHSNFPPSLETPNVISVGDGSTPTCFKKFKKLAKAIEGLEDAGLVHDLKVLTICSCIHHNKTRVHGSFDSIFPFPFDSVGMPTEPAIRFIKVNFMISTL